MAIRMKAPANYMEQKDGEDWCPGAVVDEVIDTFKSPVLYSNAG